MKKQLFLYHLIHSLSKSEKRYFKLYTKRTNSKEVREYEVIYNLILKRKSYSEEAIKAAAHVKNFAYQKKYLYDLIIRCLIDYSHQEKNNNINGQNLLSAEILFAKGLPAQALSQLKKEKKVAYNTELFGKIISAIEVEQKILSSRMDVLNTKPEFTKLTAEKKTILKKIEEVSYIEMLGVDLLNLAHHSKNNKSEAARKEYFKIIKKLNQEEDRLSSLRSELHFYRIKGSAYYLLEEYEKAISYYEKEITLSLQLKINDSNKAYFCSKLNTLASIYSRLKLAKEFDKTLKLLDSTIQEIGSAHLKKRYTLTFYILELNFYILTNNYSKLTPYLETIPTNLSMYKEEFKNSYNILCYNTACGYFYIGNYKKSLFWINKVLSENYKDMMPEVNAAARLINLVIHYQLDNLMLLDSLISSYKKTNQKKSIYAPFEKILLKFLMLLITNPNNKAGISKEYIPKLLSFKNHKTQGSIFQVFEFERWMLSLKQMVTPYLLAITIMFPN